MTFTTQMERIMLEQRVEAGVIAMLTLAGEEVGRPGLLATPRRFVQAWVEMTAHPGDPATLLATTFDDAGPVDQMVGFGPIEFASICEHHLLPFTGQAWVAYIPNDGRVVGLSKIARVLEHYARRPQVQERLTGQITAALDKFVGCLGSACQIKATHTCASMRGVRKETPMTTSSLTGAFRTDLAAREEYLSFVGKEH